MTQQYKRYRGAMIVCAPPSMPLSLQPIPAGAQPSAAVPDPHQGSFDFGGPAAMVATCPFPH